jgi:hypothetical protein
VSVNRPVDLSTIKVRMAAAVALAWLIYLTQQQPFEPELGVSAEFTVQP